MCQIYLYLGGFELMKLKRITIASIFSVIMCLLMVSTVSAAGDGEWNFIASRTIHGYSHGEYPVYSTGGDLKVCYTEGGNGGPYTIYLQEKDTWGSSEVGYATIYRGECSIFRNLNQWVDGDNNYAEFFIYFKDEKDLDISFKYYD